MASRPYTGGIPATCSAASSAKCAVVCSRSRAPRAERNSASRRSRCCPALDALRNETESTPPPGAGIRHQHGSPWLSSGKRRAGWTSRRLCASSVEEARADPGPRTGVVLTAGPSPAGRRRRGALVRDGARQSGWGCSGRRRWRSARVGCEAVTAARRVGSRYGSATPPASISKGLGTSERNTRVFQPGVNLSIRRKSASPCCWDQNLPANFFRSCGRGSETW